MKHLRLTGRLIQEDLDRFELLVLWVLQNIQNIPFGSLYEETWVFPWLALGGTVEALNWFLIQKIHKGTTSYMSSVNVQVLKMFLMLTTIIDSLELSRRFICK